MLRKFKIAIDGTEYYVEMEEIGAATSTAPAPTPIAVPVTAPAAPAVAPAPAPVTPVSAAPAPAVSAAGDDAQQAPMPGKILDIKVNVGDTVAENQVILILEAMKLENEIVAEKAGTISAIHVQSGATVNSGDALITIA